MTKPAATKRNARRSRGFTLIEMIAALTIGLLVATVLIELGFFLKHNPNALLMVGTQYATLQELERVTGEYRHEIENGDLDLNSLLGGWTTENGVTMSQETISVGSSDGSFTFHNVRKVTMTKDGQAVHAYFTE